MRESGLPKAAKFYNTIAPVYPVIDFFLQPQKQKLMQQLAKYPPGRLLEVGVGNGSHLPYYPTRPVVGIDVAEQMLKRAARRQIPGVQLLTMNGEALSFPDQSFDYVVLSHVLSVTEQPDVMVAEAHRVLKSRGKLLILNHITPTNAFRYIDSFFARAASRFRFRSNFTLKTCPALAGFKLLECRNAGWFSYFKLYIYETSH